MSSPQPVFEKALLDSYNCHIAPGPANLSQAIQYSLFAPGKRIRPRLALATAEMLKLPPEAALPAAVALEMAHCFTLIHDDLPCLDDDDFRRGRPSNHRVHGEGLALLAGDALIVAAMRSLVDAGSQSGVTPEGFHRAVHRFTDCLGPRGVIGGQCAEMLLSTQSQLEDLTQMHRTKTGALFLASILIPADLMNLSIQGPEFKILEQLAQALGAAFQIIDDLEDFKQDEGREPTNIGFYLSEEQARSHAFTPLQEARAETSRCWPQSSEVLLAIVDEVLRPLK